MRIEGPAQVVEIGGVQLSLDDAYLLRSTMETEGWGVFAKIVSVWRDREVVDTYGSLCADIPHSRYAYSHGAHQRLSEVLGIEEAVIDEIEAAEKLSEAQAE